MKAQIPDPEPVVLADGGSLIVRAIRPDDKARLADHFAHLGFESVRHRFFGAKRELTPKDLAYYTELDLATHVGLVATLVERGEERIVGVGRYFVDGRRAEVAFAVVDAHQGRGIGTVLLDRLARIARAHGVEELYAEVLADNAAMLDVFRHSGFEVRERRVDGIVHVSLSARPAPSTARGARSPRRPSRGRGGARHAGHGSRPR
jgi:GNAT superfamily N-acetyltransferase